MFRREEKKIEDQHCFPRIRGDVPKVTVTLMGDVKFSPHTRGCSESQHHQYASTGVFPAYAGMFRQALRQPPMPRSFPRIRGDVPSPASKFRLRKSFSPHTRGCSSWCVRAVSMCRVFPAYAGMFRSGLARSCPRVRFPRIRGDVPTRNSTPMRKWRFSPHTRGCSYATPCILYNHIVFPAYAGMFRVRQDVSNHAGGFPRIRGDVPHPHTPTPPHNMFSPHTRGCSS